MSGGSDAEVIVLGGGPAGAAAALALARAGRRVLLVEREAAPREKVCGEFLGADAAACLRALGLDLAEMGGIPVRGARIAHRGRTAVLALPFPAWGLPRRILDEVLLREAAAAGATLLRGRAALGAAREGAGWAVRLTGGEVMRARRLVLATGKHELRGHGRGGGASVAGGGALGLKLQLRLRRPPPEEVVLLSFPGGYAGLQPTTDGLANLCAALPRPGRGDASAGDASALIARVAAGSALGAALLERAEPVLARPLAVARIPYGFLHRDGPGADPGLFRIGDQFAVVPSFCGDGVAMALTGGMEAAEAIAAGRTAPEFHAAWRRRLMRPMRVAGAVAAMLAAHPGLLLAGAALLPRAVRGVALRTRVPGLGA